MKADSGESSVTMWGSGSPLREFLDVDDLAAACFIILEGYDESSPIDVRVGEDLTIRDLAKLVARIVGYKGNIVWDPTVPGGTHRKVLDVTKIDALGWRSLRRLIRRHRRDLRLVSDPGSDLLAADHESMSANGRLTQHRPN